MSTPKLAEIAARILAHLRRFEADTQINWHNREGTSRYWSVGALASGSRVGVCYIAYQGWSYMTKADALRYLAWLDADNVGRHFEALRKLAPPPGSGGQP